MLCPCGSDKDYAEYLLSTSLAKNHAVNELEQLKAQMNLVEWLQLDVVDAHDNVVEFKAYYRDESGIEVLHERSSFVYENNRWFYDEGTLFNTRIERNQLCPCGSGKKHKKCCG